MTRATFGWLLANSFVVSAVVSIAAFKGFESVLDVVLRSLRVKTTNDAMANRDAGKDKWWTVAFAAVAMVSAIGILTFYGWAFYIAEGDTKLKTFPADHGYVIDSFYACVGTYLVTQLALYARRKP
jgi:hypothetical protein